MTRQVDLIYPKECYDLVGCAYAVYNEIKYGHHERSYQKGYSIELQRNGYLFHKEVCVRITYQGKDVGKYFLDFLVEDKIVVELKVANDFHEQHIRQVLSYLKSTNKRLGIIILFTVKGIKYRRIVN